jgi:hypothetical protein
MTKRLLTLSALLVLTLNLAACELIGGVFKVGLWAGVFLVVVVLLVIWGIARLFR